MHEWSYLTYERPKTIFENNNFKKDKTEPINNLVTWVYEEGGFVPSCKITERGVYSIISDYLGRPIQAFDSNDKLVWHAEYDIYGRIKMLIGNKRSIPFRQLGQYEDSETELYYNRFRYYDYNTGGYISRDPIGLLGNNPNLYAYTHDTNSWTDVFGLDYYRGVKEGESLWDVRSFDVKVDTDGNVLSQRGVSVFSDADKVRSTKRVPFKVDESSIPSSLKVVPHGQEGHFEIIPKEAMPLDEYEAELNKIKVYD